MLIQPWGIAAEQHIRLAKEPQWLTPIRIALP